MSDWLNGSTHDLALAFGGEAVRYDELADAIASATLPPGDGPIGCPAGTDPVSVVVRVLAALEHGRPVLVGGSQRDADLARGDLPPGTELALLTSGSSGGAPRIVARTSASWLASAAPLADLAAIGPDDRVAVTGPLHVSMHLYAVLHALWLGATATDAVDGASVMHATPTRLARALDGASCPPSVVVAGATLSDELRARTEARGIRLTEYYGAAELSFVLGGRGGALLPFPGVEVEVRPTTGEAGDELWARSPFLALGLVGDGMLRRDARGFATVGDLVERTASGALRVLGRGDAAITTAGATVLAEQVEARLLELQGVSAAAVLGEPHELLGQRVVAVVELEAGATLDAVVSAARGALTTPELPRRWFVAAVPRTASGKVARGALRDAIAERRLGAPYPAAQDRGDG